MQKKIKTALISVFHKEGLDQLVLLLFKNNIKIYSTGGTKKFIESLQVPVTSVEEITSYPSILGGRVKTLHPKVFGGILARLKIKDDVKDVSKHDIPIFDLVIVDLYPFQEAVADRVTHAEIIEKIDIGGISLIRAAAKNYNYVLTISSKNQYGFLEKILKKGSKTSLEERKIMAGEAFKVSSNYDVEIQNYFTQTTEKKSLRYGENPHQKGAFYGNINSVFEQLHGKELSYNNFLDIDAAINLIAEFNDTTVAVLKHNNACGISSRKTLLNAWKDALAGDPVSAFGGIVILNKKLNLATAKEINNIFYEIIIAPSFEKSAIEILESKKNRIILKQKKVYLPTTIKRTVLNGILEQDRDLKTDSKKRVRTVTKKQPTEAEIDDLIFASKVCKHTKSNTIVLVKNKQLFGSGTGQTSRVDALKQAIQKAKSLGFNLQNAVMASDAFFPFPDCVEIAHNAGVNAIIQPGGSIKDKLSINYCNNNNMTMVFTGIRHFKH